MANINKEEWTKLVDIKSLDPVKIKRSNLEKFLGSFILLFIYAVVAYSLELRNDVYICMTLMFFALINSSLSILAKTEKQLLNILHFAKIVSLLPLGIGVILNLDADSIRFSFIFTFLYFVYIYDFYFWNKKEFIFLYIFAISQVLFFKEALIFKVILFLIITFITYIARDNILLREENKQLLHLEKTYKVFQSHTNLIEHHILNSINKILYYQLQLEEIGEGQISEIAEKLAVEINYIEKVIKETKGEDLKNFAYEEKS